MNKSTSNTAASNASTAKISLVCTPCDWAGEKNPELISNKPASPTRMISGFFPTWKSSENKTLAECAASAPALLQRRMCWHQVLCEDRLEPSWNALSLAGCQSSAWSSAESRAGSVGCLAGGTMLSFHSQAQTTETKTLSLLPGVGSPSLLPIMPHRGPFFEGCGGLGK